MGNPAFLPSEAVFKIWAIPWFNLWKKPLFASPAVKRMWIWTALKHPNIRVNLKISVSLKSQLDFIFLREKIFWPNDKLSHISYELNTVPLWPDDKVADDKPPSDVFRELIYIRLSSRVRVGLPDLAIPWNKWEAWSQPCSHLPGGHRGGWWVDICHCFAAGAQRHWGVSGVGQGCTVHLEHLTQTETRLWVTKEQFCSDLSLVCHHSQAPWPA